jgi:tight adherence protein B
MQILQIVLIVACVVLLIALIVGVLLASNSDRAVDQRLDRLVEQEQKQDQKKEGEASYVTEWFNKRVESSSYGDRVARDLARADLKFKVAEYFAMMVILSIALGLLVVLINHQIPLLSFGIGAVVGLIIPGVYVKSQQKKRLQKFNDQLGDMLNLMVNGLRAGYSTMQAMEAVSKELPSPICDEFRRVVQEMQLGIPMEKALDNLLRRIPSEDLDFCVTAINVQREVGGNLSEILDTISFTIRERVRIKGEIRVLTSQVRSSGGFLSMIPIILTGILYLIAPDYLGTFFDKGILVGAVALGCAGLLIASGYMIMMKIADIEV